MSGQNDRRIQDRRSRGRSTKIACLAVCNWMFAVGLVLAVVLPGGQVIGADATVPGEVSTPCPTIRNLAVEWKIKGDDNLNGTVTVRFREIDKDVWQDAMPLRRVPAGQSRGTTPARSGPGRPTEPIHEPPGRVRPSTRGESELLPSSIGRTNTRAASSTCSLIRSTRSHCGWKISMAAQPKRPFAFGPGPSRPFRPGWRREP